MTKDDIIRTAREAGAYRLVEANKGSMICISQAQLERFAELARAAEREQCAKACEDYTDKSDADHESHGYSCAAAIRARGQA